MEKTRRLIVIKTQISSMELIQFTPRSPARQRQGIDPTATQGAIR